MSNWFELDWSDFFLRIQEWKDFILMKGFYPYERILSLWNDVILMKGFYPKNPGMVWTLSIALWSFLLEEVVICWCWINIEKSTLLMMMIRLWQDDDKDEDDNNSNYCIICCTFEGGKAAAKIVE